MLFSVQLCKLGIGPGKAMNLAISRHFAASETLRHTSNAAEQMTKNSIQLKVGYFGCKKSKRK